ncbi:hypothetical protein F5Y17DRAFT_228795 [Xylariaceae sp. FL0594]|nr:hypothetical protein F5Y17DRAFT_228795 [Xylariaceae sp. FL0594]
MRPPLITSVSWWAPGRCFFAARKSFTRPKAVLAPRSRSALAVRAFRAQNDCLTYIREPSTRISSTSFYRSNSLHKSEGERAYREILPGSQPAPLVPRPLLALRCPFTRQKTRRVGVSEMADNSTDRQTDSLPYRPVGALAFALPCLPLHASEGEAAKQSKARAPGGYQEVVAGVIFLALVHERRGFPNAEQERAMHVLNNRPAPLEESELVDMVPVGP